jgi:hypothetical protein
MWNHLVTDLSSLGAHIMSESEWCTWLVPAESADEVGEIIRSVADDGGNKFSECLVSDFGSFEDIAEDCSDC